MSTNVSSEQAREALRREHGVQLVSSEREGTAASALPAGTYGFTGSPALASPLFATRRYRNFEVHQLPSGPALIGFATAASAARLREADEAVTLEVYPDAQGESATIVSIPYDRIVQHRQYSIRNAESIALQVLPSRAAAATA